MSDRAVSAEGWFLPRGVVEPGDLKCNALEEIIVTVL
jgi:hypothetical protein